MELTLIVLPLIFAGTVFITPHQKIRRTLLPLAAAVHLTVVVFLLIKADFQRNACGSDWICLDAGGGIWLSVRPENNSLPQVFYYS